MLFDIQRLLKQICKMSLKKSCMLLYLKCQIAHTYTHTHTIAEKEENVKKENNATWQKHE